MECVVYLAGVACHFVSRPVANDLFDPGRCYIREVMSLHVENFLLIEEVLLQDVKFGIWCGVSAAMTLAPPPHTHTHTHQQP